MAASWIISLVVAACGSSDAGGNKTPAGAGGPGPGGWQTLVSGDWALDPGSERYFCVRQTLATDTWVQAFSAMNPTGTHHTVLTVGPPDAPDGITACDATMQKSLMLFASGVGTNAIQFPDGVAVKLEAGQQVLLNLHLFNTTASSLSGTSGTRMVRVAADAVQYPAQALLMGTETFDLPPGVQTTVAGDCTQNADTTVFALMPHIHQLGVHMTVTAQSSASGNVILHDQDYSFDDQSIRDVGPVQMKAGDKVHVECTYDNVTKGYVSYGQSTLDEMCYAAVYRFPMAPTGRITCTH